MSPIYHTDFFLTQAFYSITDATARNSSVPVQQKWQSVVVFAPPTDSGQQYGQYPSASLGTCSADAV